MILFVKYFIFFHSLVGFSKDLQSQKASALESKAKIASEILVKDVDLEQVQIDNYEKRDDYLGCYCDIGRLVILSEPIGFEEVLIQLNGKAIRLPITEERKAKEIDKKKNHVEFAAKGETIDLKFTCDEIAQLWKDRGNCEGAECTVIHHVCDIDVNSKDKKKSKKYRALKGGCYC